MLMRIVSQSGYIDLPYELVGLSLGKKRDNSIYCIYAHSQVINLNNCPMAKYSTEKKAIKAMKMVREAYMGLPVVFQNTNIDDSVLESFKNHNVVLLNSYDNQQSKVEYVNSGIFQFPKDDEIEV